MEAKASEAIKPGAAPVAEESAADAQKKADSSAKRSEEATKVTNLQNDIAVQSKRWVRYQVGTVMATIILMIVQHEIAWKANTTVGYGAYCSRGIDPLCDQRKEAQMFPVLKSRSALNAIRGVITGLTVVLVYATYRYYKEGLRYSITRNLASMHATVLGSSLTRWPFILEFLILAVHPFPDCDQLGGINGSRSAYLFLSMFMFVKLYVFGRLFQHYSDLNSGNGKFIGALTHVEYSVTFVMKKIIKENPMPLLSAAMITFLLCSAYSLRNIESIICAQNLQLNCQPLTFADALWLIVMTILTVGYGDYYPSSHGGRIVCVMAGVVGIFVATATIVLSFEFLSLSRSESKVVSFMRKDQYRHQIDEAAVRAVQAAVRYRIATNKYKRSLASKSISRGTSGAHLLASDGSALSPTAVKAEPFVQPKHLKAMEQHMFDAIHVYRRKKRWVASHDPVSLEDRQVMLLESLVVNVEQVRAAVTTVSEYLEDPNHPVLPSAVGPAPGGVGRLVAPGTPHHGKHGVDSSTAASLNEHMEALSGQIAALQHRLSAHMEATARRLNTIERRLGIEIAEPVEAGLPSATLGVSRKRISVRDVTSSDDGVTAVRPLASNAEAKASRKSGPPPLTATADDKPTASPGAKDTAQPKKAGTTFKSPIGSGRPLNDSDEEM